MSGTSTEMVSHRVQMELPVTTRHQRFFSDDRDLDVNGHDKESLSETRRPDFISTVRSDLPQTTWMERENPPVVERHRPGS
jgi:hypothetical protein